MNGRSSLIILTLAVVLCLASSGPSAASERTQDAASSINRAMALIDLVMEHHVDPPTRHEMILGGARMLCKAADAPQPIGLSRRVSRLSSEQEFRTFLEELWDLAKTSTSTNLNEILLGGILSAVPGEPFIIPAKQFKVDEQLAANRYVGIGVTLAIDRDSGFPRIQGTFARGSAHQCGAKDGDLMTSIDGIDAHKMFLQRAIELLRGEEGTSVTLKLRQPDQDETRTITIPRTVVPRQTVVGYDERAKEEWTYGADSSESIAYLRITEFNSSTVHELRQVERELRNFRALILDLRGYVDSRLSEAAMVADALLDAGIIGQVRTSTGVRKFEADADCLFREWPMAALVSEYTSGEMEWLAAALQDRQRAVLVGQPTAGQGLTFTTVPTGDGGALRLATGIMERGNGKSLPTPAPYDRRRSGPNRDPARAGVKPDHTVTLPERPKPPADTNIVLRFDPALTQIKIDTPSEKTGPQGEKGRTGYEVEKQSSRSKEKDPVLSKAIEILQTALDDRAKVHEATTGQE